MSDLAEVYSIVLYSNNGDNNNAPTRIKDVEIEGGVVAYDRKWHFLFNPEQGFETVLPDGTLHLTGPSRCLEGEDWCAKFSLRDKNRQIQLSRGYISFSPLCIEQFYSEPICGVIHGNNGYAVVHCTIFKSAVQATIDVFLSPGAGPTVSACYGHIRAHHDQHNNVYQKKYFKSTLFYASEQKPKQLQHTKIPLSRSAVAVDLDGKLVIEAELFDPSTKSVIASGKVFCYAQTSSTTLKTIGGIEVKITWVNDPIHTLK